MKNIVFDLAIEHINKAKFTKEEFKKMAVDFCFYSETGVATILVSRYQNLLKSFLKKRNITLFSKAFKTGAFNSAISYLIEKSIYISGCDTSYEIAQQVVEKNKEQLTERYNKNEISVPADIIEQYNTLIEDGVQKDMFWNKDKNIQEQILITAWYSTQEVGYQAYYTPLMRYYMLVVISFPIAIFCLIPNIIEGYIIIAGYMLKCKVKMLNMDTIRASVTWKNKFTDKFFLTYKTIMLITATFINYYIYRYFFG